MKGKLKVIVPLSMILLAIIVVAGSFAWKDKNNKETELMSASWSYNYGDIEEISQASDMIALVKVDGVSSSYIESGLPFTEFKVDVMTPIYNAEENDKFTILMTGGETDESILELDDDPLLQPGDEILVFCQKNEDGTYAILSGPQGRLVYSDGKLNSLNVVNSRVMKANQDSNITVTNADADEMIGQIKAYVNAE